MLRNQIQISVLMAAFNAEKYVGDAIQTILNQDLQNLELIVVDDASTDNTKNILKQLAQNDPRIKIITNASNQGLVRSLNTGLLHCRAEFVARADADDLFTLNRISTQYHYLIHNPNVGVIGSKVEFIDPNGKPLNRHLDFFPSTFAEIRLHSLLGCQIWHTTVMFRKSLVVDNGGYSEALHGGPEDYELWTRLFKKTQFFNIPTPLAYQRIHPQSITATWTIGFRMFCEVARTLQSEYLSRSISLEEAEALVKLCGCEGNIDKTDIAIALELLTEILETAKQRENASVYATFLGKCKASLEQQAENTVYSLPEVSRSLSLYIRNLDPSFSTIISHYKRFIKSRIPKSARRFLSQIIPTKR